MANWAPYGLADGMFKAIAALVPPPPGLRPAADWGRRERLGEFFGPGIAELRVEPRVFWLRYPSLDYTLEYFRTWFGPTNVAFASLDDAGQQALAAALLDVWRSHNRATDGTLVTPSDYVEVAAVRA